MPFLFFDLRAKRGYPGFSAVLKLLGKKPKMSTLVRYGWALC